MGIKSSILSLEKYITNPRYGVGSEIFEFFSRNTPMVNIDLLITNKEKEILLTWRDDKFYGPAWHIPGGVVRYGETLENRVHLVAKQELGCKIHFNKNPILINELFDTAKEARGHFISFLYLCDIKSNPNEELQHQPYAGKSIVNGHWKWHKKIPTNFLDSQHIYIPKINKFILP